MGRGSERRRPEAARPTVDAARHATQDRPAVSGAGHHPSHAGAAVASLPPAVQRAPACHRPGLGRSLSSRPFLDPAGSLSLHRRGRRAAPYPRRHARARDPTGPGGESPARPPGEGGRRKVVAITPARSRRRGRRARAWSTCCSTSGSTCVRPRASTHGAPGPTFQGGSEDRNPRSSRRPRPCRPPGWRALAGGAPAGRCGSRNGRLRLRDRAPLDSADVAAATGAQGPAPESPRDRRDVTNPERPPLDPRRIPIQRLRRYSTSAC